MTTLIEFILAIKESPFYQAPVISALIAAALAVWGIKTQRTISRQKNSLDFESAYKRNNDLIKHNENIVKLIQDIHSKKIVNADDFFKKIATTHYSELSDDEKEINRSISTILNEWERTANATFSGLYDEDYLYRAHGTAIIQIYSSFKVFIQKRQEVNPRLFVNFTMLSVKWGVRRCKEDNDKLDTKVRKHLLIISGNGVSFSGHTVTESIDGHIKPIGISVNILRALVSKNRLAYFWYYLRSKTF